MLDLNNFVYFVQVIDRRGISAAAKSLRMPKSTVSHRIQQLENSLGARLINRNTRQFCPTEAGLQFYRHAIEMLRKAEEAESSIREQVSEPSGLVRYTIAVATSQHAMLKLVPGFLDRYPKVRLQQHTSDAALDLVAEGFDVAIRAHSKPLPNSSLVQRPLAKALWALFAGRGYLEKNGRPKSPEELAGHAALHMQRDGIPHEWRLHHKRKKPYVIPIRPRYAVNCMASLKRAARDGFGIVALPAYVCREDVQRGDLVRVLPDWHAGDSTLTALAPFKHGQLPAVRAFIDYLVTEFPRVVE